MKVKAVKVLSAAILAGSVAAGGTAWAQAANQSAMPNPNHNNFRMATPSRGIDLLDDFQMRSLKSGKKQIPISEARLQRASHVAALLNEGQCLKAYTTAMDAHDVKLAKRVTELCAPQG